MRDPFSQPQALSPSSPSSRPLSPLEVPELLENIFSYLSRYTLARAVVLVCREWLLLAQGRLHREVAWDADWKAFAPQTALERLPGAERLVVRSVQPSFDWMGPDIHAAFQDLQRSSSQLALEDRYKGTALAGLNQPLRDIVLVTAYNLSDKMKNTLPFPPFLRSLTIDNLTRFAIDIRRILTVCPLLESLHLLTSAYVYLHGSWSTDGQEPLPDRLPLRSLVIQRLDTGQSRMEEMLTFTPNLEDLRLIAVQKKRNGSRWDWQRFSRHLQSLCLPLKRFHFSNFEEFSPDDELQEATFSICPHARERTFWHHDLTPAVIRGLTDLPFFLTSLEILPSPDYLCHPQGWKLAAHLQTSIYSARPLHLLLCECPSLRHLKTLRITYMLEFMDIHRRLDMFAPHENNGGGGGQATATLDVTPGIWICRNLSILEVVVHFHRSGVRRGAHIPRIAYGYISRVCPRLQDLRITFPYFCAIHINSRNGRDNPFDLDGGMCLLSRLVHLERLCVYYQTVDCKIWELNWLCRSGRTVEHREARRWAADGWTSMLGVEAGKEKARLKNRNSMKTDPVLGSDNSQNLALMTGLRNLGLLQDVKDMVLEMDREGFVCLPELYQLAVGRLHLEQSPEKEIRSTFDISQEPRRGIRQLG